MKFYFAFFEKNNIWKWELCFSECKVDIKENLDVLVISFCVHHPCHCSNGVWYSLSIFLSSLTWLLGVQRDMLRDESNCDGGSIVEKLESFVQGRDVLVFVKVPMK